MTDNAEAIYDTFLDLSARPEAPGATLREVDDALRASGLTVEVAELTAVFNPHGESLNVASLKDADGAPITRGGLTVWTPKELARV